ncbi:MAG TPA: hypothetical protein VEZ90_05545, partial [Blastocatellia bacterium]|nr:hypothetical protein [Blastocatellia bacterium]
LLFAGNSFVGHWFTPMVWTGYILFVDALVYQVRGESLLVSNRAEFVLMAVISIAYWWLFEFYNAPRFWESDLELWWHYHNLVPNPYLRVVGYSWAFATISPAMFETAQLFEATVFASRFKGKARQVSRSHLYLLTGIGLAGAAIPLLFINRWLVPIVWLSYILLFDPINTLRRRPSVLSDARAGRYRRLISLLAAGMVCGFLWEFWNYWAIGRWTYTVPYLGDIKVFEMPVLGFLGFPPFAVECWAVYIFCRSLLGPPTAGTEWKNDRGFWPSTEQERLSPAS